MSIKELAKLLALSEEEIIKTLFMRGIMATVNQTLDKDTVSVIASEYNVELWDKNEVSLIKYLN